MPKVTINEIDSSRYVVPSLNAPMTVLVPGTASFGPTFESTDPRVSIFNGELDLPNFFNAYGYNPAVLDDTGNVIPGDLSYEYATNLMRSGAQILYYRINEGVAATIDSAHTYEYTTTDESDPTQTVTEESTYQVSAIAKYNGRFGNTLVFTIDADLYDETAGVLGVYSFPTEFEEIKTDITPADLLSQTVSKLYYSRVSTEPDNQYFIGSNDNGFVVIEADVLSEMITESRRTGNTVIFNLAGGKDYTTAADVPAGVTPEVVISGGSYDFTAIEDKLEQSYAAFRDPYLFEFDIVTNGGLIGIAKESGATNSFMSLNIAMLNLAKNRGDCIAILDTPQNFSYIDVSNYASNGSINSSYGAIYAPWCSFVSTTTGKTQMMPPSIIFLKALLLGMQSQVQSELWYVPAGVARTSAPFIVDTKYEIGSTILDVFQNLYDYRVNPIMRLRNYGYCVYGNATTMRAIPGLPHSALESLNVRLISNVIKQHIFNVCSGLSFEYNNSDLWLKFYSQMDEKLLYMKRNYGLYDYRIEMGASTVTTADLNERRVPGKVIISPTLAGEYFDIDFEIMPSGVSFAEEEV